MMLRKWVVAFAAIIALGLGASAQANEPPFNRIGILLDASGSYRERQADAVEKANLLLSGLAERRSKRWVKPDEIVIISMDASPEVIWRGSPQKLAETDRSEWIARFHGRADYAACTDVARGLNLAADELNAGPVPTARYLFVFSDLIAEPPTRGVSVCAAPRAVPERDVNWDALKPVSIAAFWLPADQKMVWDATMKTHGLTTYRLFSISESAVNRIDLPEPAKHDATPAEKQQSRDTLWSWLGTIGSLLVYLLLLIVIVPLLAGVVLYLRRRRPQAAAPAATPVNRPGVAVRGPVAPLRVPPRS